MRKFVVIAITVGVLAIGIGAAWAGARHGTSAADGPELTISSLTGAPGDLISVAGSGCPGDADDAPHEGEWEAQVWFAPVAGTVEWQPQFGDPVAYITPDGDGNWSTELRVPEWRTEYKLEAACFDEAQLPNGFLYGHELFVAG